VCLSIRPLLVALGLAVPLCACSDQPAVYAPVVQPSVLVGEFGSRSFEVVATDTAAHFTLTCVTGRTGALQRSIEGGDLEASGTATTSTLLTQPLFVAARVNGDLLSITVTLGSGPTSRTNAYLAQRGVPGDFSGIGCAG
jgi:hypothetical protein